MRRFEGHQQRETNRDEAVFTESAAVKVGYILLRLTTRSRHNRAIRESGKDKLPDLALLSDLLFASILYERPAQLVYASRGFDPLDSLGSPCYAGPRTSRRYAR